MGHGKLGCLQDIDPVDYLDLNAPDPHGHCSAQDQLVQALPSRTDEYFAIAKAGNPVPLGQDDRRSDHRPSE
jgi:hypothetical protein